MKGKRGVEVESQHKTQIKSKILEAFKLTIKIIRQWVVAQRTSQGPVRALRKCPRPMVKEWQMGWNWEGLTKGPGKVADLGPADGACKGARV